MSDEGVRDTAGPGRLALRELWLDEGAPTAVEYGLMLGGIAAAIFATVAQLGQAVLGLFERATSSWP